MKLVLAAAAAVSALALSACGMLGEEQGPAPGTPAAKAPAALPPPATLAAPPPAAATPAPPPEPEDLTPVPADQVKCIPPFVIRTIEKDGQTEARCVAPSEASPRPN
jgi:hypothetical protein